MSQAEKGEHKRFCVHEPCEVRWCCAAAAVAAAAVAVSLLYCADAFEIQSKCGLESSLGVFRMACPHSKHTRTHAHNHTHARTHRSTVRSCHKKKTLKCGYLLFHDGDTNVKSLRRDSTRQQQTAYYYSKNEIERKKLNDTSLLETVFLVPTAVESYNTHAHTHAHEHTHAEVPSVAVTEAKA